MDKFAALLNGDTCHWEIQRISDPVRSERISNVGKNIPGCDVGTSGTHSSLDYINPADKKNMSWYARVVAHHPYMILVAVVVFSTTCLVIPLTTKSLPNFADPQLRLTAWKNLLRATRPSGQLTVNPYDQPATVSPNSVSAQDARFGVRQDLEPAPANWAEPPDYPSTATERPSVVLDYSKNSAAWAFTFNITELAESRNWSEADTFRQNEWDTLTAMESVENEQLEHYRGHQHLGSDGFFCGAPSGQYSRVVVSSVDGTDLFSLEGVRDMCRLEWYLMSVAEPLDICQEVIPGRCCQPWSLPGYIALLHNRSSCLYLTEEDVEDTRALLRLCAHYYHDLKLTPDCDNGDYVFCRQVPPECSRHNAAYNVLHFLLDSAYLPPGDVTNNSLSNVMLILPVAQSEAAMPFYHRLDSHLLRQGSVKVTAIEFGLKNTLFDECLVRDTWMIGAGGLFILLCMWWYTGSLFLTVMTTIAIAFSLGISYFMYTLVFELSFFPFMNLLASIVVIGIGADDAFIFCKVWQCSKVEKNNSSLVRLVDETLRHATLSMFVTTLTTAAAFYASYVTSITAIGCFSVFAGTATLANFVLMVTWLPASVVVSERCCCPPMVPSKWSALANRLQPARAAADQVHAALDRALLLLVVKLRYVWVVVLGAVAAASVVVVFYYPRLKLPDSKDFQLFDSHHLFEQYDLVYKDIFWFERLHKGNGDFSLNTKLPLRFVWGVLPVDNGNYLDPYSRGSLQLDPSFDMAAPESQRWLMGFCHRLRNQSWYQPELGPLLPNCFIESFSSWMERRCIDPIDRLNRTPCCGVKRRSFAREVFEQCVVLAIADLYRTPLEYFMPGVAGPKFCKGSDPPKICAVVVEYDSNHSFSMSFRDMDRFYRQVESWTKRQLNRAPPGMQGGWFISDLEFYDLQRTLSQDTLLAIGVSMGIALAVLLLVTLNILISLYAIFTITCIIFVTVATLVLLGWKLNVLESVAISVAIGLAVDFSLHYGVHYRMCPGGDDDRSSAVAFAISRMGGPTAMAALTTAAAGAFMLPSSVLAYIQIGVFLVVVMVVSWVYSTFFLGALLRIGGPQNGFGQFSYPTVERCCGGDTGGSGVGSVDNDQVDKTAYTNVLSESTLSTSSTAYPLHQSSSESHELDALSSRRHSSLGRRLKRSGSASAAQAASNCRLTRKVSLPADQSPSATSATTIVLIDDMDLDLRHGPHETEVPLMKY
ncbi:protein dispatched isoform X2 [Bacillus rossius redtenbacheri]|uniref:protein dispatched isoform X2 n=1 Tax=Bacillus rossius redtenbacheri TaxID=93214 RepID=UPI002FDD29D5